MAPLPLGIMNTCDHASTAHLTHGWCPDCDEPTDRRPICPSCHALRLAEELACPKCGMLRPAEGGWPRLPMVIGPCLALMHLGQEPSAVEVFAARGPEGDLVAVRLVSRGEATGRRMARHFQRQCEVADRFEGCPAVLRPLDHGVLKEGHAYLVSQLSRGSTLAQVMGPPVQGNDPHNPTRRRPIEALRVVRLFRRLVGALARVHRQGLVHGSLTPAGVVVEEQGATEQVRLADLGLLLPRPDEPRGAGPSGGTPLDPEIVNAEAASYLAPEQISGDAPPGPWTDLHAAAVVAYELLTGRLPRRAVPPGSGDDPALGPKRWGPLAAARLQGVLTGEVVPPGQLHPGLPASLEDCLLACLDPRPERRYQRAGQVVVQLALVEQDLADEEPQPPTCSVPWGPDGVDVSPKEAVSAAPQGAQVDPSPPAASGDLPGQTSAEARRLEDELRRLTSENRQLRQQVARVAAPPRRPTTTRAEAPPRRAVDKPAPPLPGAAPRWAPRRTSVQPAPPAPPASPAPPARPAPDTQPPARPRRRPFGAGVVDRDTTVDRPIGAELPTRRTTVDRHAASSQPVGTVIAGADEVFEDALAAALDSGAAEQGERQAVDESYCPTSIVSADEVLTLSERRHLRGADPAVADLPDDDDEEDEPPPLPFDSDEGADPLGDLPTGMYAPGTSPNARDDQAWDWFGQPLDSDAIPGQDEAAIWWVDEPGDQEQPPAPTVVVPAEQALTSDEQQRLRQNPGRTGVDMPRKSKI